ncbi:hypothetical protein HG536_0G02170 [Torulaspora globosa]|uniref:Uncharacterized protein n=1 Tax=Torulaspora globosa TaxID=48254 RepID=A0A7G3ZLH2_9SACH|nr:uncharacterized protein HG536_0G02170 [Torulaspora globosa]QLL34358.1 hypothetical protein HG536_0G02170 [Torulaspora globosa]
MDELTISYGLLAPQSKVSRDLHILPITKILYPEGQDGFFLTCSRDGSIIKNRFDAFGRLIRGKRMQAHSDWVTDIIQISRNKFITVSHDFSIVLLTLHDDSDTWETKIIGDHGDYIKCIVHIPTDDNEFVFATGGLDRKVKFWNLKDDQAYLIDEFLNSSDHDETGSIYAMAAIDHGMGFNLLIGDCNGDLILYSTTDKREFGRLTKAHKANIKIVKSLDHSSKLVTACSDGLICVWDLKEDDKLVKCASYQWDCSVWGIYGTDLNMVYIGDSKGRIKTADLSKSDQMSAVTIYDEAQHVSGDFSGKESKHGGILDLMISPDGFIMFSQSINSNLSMLDLRTGKLEVIKGGFALIKSSLLTNRRHVITENTKGEIQRWDIVVCELVNTFEPAEGGFDEVVTKYTSKEVLSHWCSVSVKVGMLFVKLNPRMSNTEVYGSALEGYRILNEVELNSDERYNLGKIVINSLFKEFVSYEMEKDKTYRKQLSSRKKDQNVAASAMELNLNFTESKIKDKRRKSAFYRFGSATPYQEYNMTSLSAPNTPLFSGEATGLPVDEHPLLPPPMTSAGDKLTYEENELGVLSPFGASESRTLSSGSLIARKFKKLRPYSRNGSGTHTTVDSQATNSDFEDSTPEDEHPGERIVWNQAYNGENLSSQQAAEPLHAKFKPIETPATAAHQDIEPNTLIKDRATYISDFFEQLHETYKQHQNSNSTSLKLLSRKLPESKIIRDPSLPIIRIRNGVLLVVHSWNKRCCGGKVLFSSYLPASRSLDDDDASILQESDEDVDSNEDEERLSKYDLMDNEYGNVMNRRQMFEQLEENLPFWFAKYLFCDERTAKQQPKLSFVIAPWQDHDGPISSGSQPQQSHHRLKFGRTKSADVSLGTTELPKISEINTKLVAPGMIKVKKIKVYIADRFEAKTPEMKAKIDPSEWIELLCKSQVLDNDMTLSTVRTLYWKSQSDIVFKYRRKMADATLVTGGDGNSGSGDI